MKILHSSQVIILLFATYFQDLFSQRRQRNDAPTKKCPNKRILSFRIATQSRKLLLQRARQTKSVTCTCVGLDGSGFFFCYFVFISRRRRTKITIATTICMHIPAFKRTEKMMIHSSIYTEMTNNQKYNVCVCVHSTVKKAAASQRIFMFACGTLLYTHAVMHIYMELKVFRVFKSVYDYKII